MINIEEIENELKQEKEKLDRESLKKVVKEITGHIDYLVKQISDAKNSIITWEKRFEHLKKHPELYSSMKEDCMRAWPEID